MEVGGTGRILRIEEERGTVAKEGVFSERHEGGVGGSVREGQDWGVLRRVLVRDRCADENPVDHRPDPTHTPTWRGKSGVGDSRLRTRVSSAVLREGRSRLHLTGRQPTPRGTMSHERDLTS